MQGSIIKVIEKNNVKYRLLDYIESNGNQYINTGLKGNEIYGFELDILPKVVKPSSSSIYYTYLATGPTIDNFTIGVFRNAPGIFYRNRGTAIYQNEGNIVSQYTRHKITSLGNTFKVDNTSLATNVVQPLGSLGENLKLLGNHNGETGQGVAGQLFSFKLYGNNNSLILDLIPVEKLDGTLGMLDLVSGNFLTNAGTGTFTKGNYLKVEHIYKPKLKAKTYEILDSITSDGNQYIKLGVSGNGLAEWDVKFKANNRIGTNWSVLFGHRPSGSSTDDLEICAYSLSSRSSFNQIANSNDSRVTTGDVGTTTIWRCIKQGNKLSIKDYTEEPLFDGTFNQNPSLTFTLEDYLFAMNVNNSVGYSCIATFYYLKYYANGVLDRDLIPVKRLSDNAIGVYDRVRKQFYGNSGTGAFVGQSLSTPEYIEEDVEQVDYIQSSGTQYINTGIKPSPSIDVELDIKCSANQNGGLIGGGVGYQNNEFFIYWETPTNLYYERSNTSVQKAKSSSFITQRHLFKTDGTKLYVDGTLELTTGANTSTSNYPLCIGALNRSGVIGFIMPMTIYGSKIYSSGSLVQHLVPVKIRTTNEYCLLDLVEMKLYHNAGTGAFSGGTRTEVQKLTQCLISNNVKYYPLDYLESSGTQYITTNIRPNGNERFEFEFTPLEWSSSTNNTVCGARRSANGLMVFGSILEAYGGGSRLANFTYNANISKMTLNVKHKVRYERDKMWYDGTLYTATGRQLIDVGYNMVLFASSNDGTIAGHTKMKLHNFIVYNADLTEKEHWLPMQRASDNVLGLLDIISGNFKTNSGSGSFVAGNKREIILVE